MAVELFTLAMCLALSCQILSSPFMQTEYYIWKVDSSEHFKIVCILLFNNHWHNRLGAGFSSIAFSHWKRCLSLWSCYTFEYWSDIDFTGTDSVPLITVEAFLKIPLDTYWKCWMPYCFRKPCLLDTDTTFFECSISFSVI